MRDMAHILTLAVAIAAGLGFEATAESPEERAHAAGDAYRFGAFTEEKLQETLHTESDPAQTRIDPGTLEQRAQEEVISTSSAGRHYRTIAANLEAWVELELARTALDVADAAVQDPKALLGAGLFSATGEALACTVTGFESAPAFGRTCDRTLQTYQTTCTRIPSVEVTVHQRFECEDADCAPLAAEPACTLSETVCADFDGSVCQRSLHSYACSAPSLLAFPVTQIGTTTYAPPVVSWQEICAPDYDPALCTPTLQSCEAGPSVEYKHGVAVPLDCGSPSTTYDCLRETYVSDCAVFAETDGCALERSTCLFTTPDGTCSTFEDVYSCGGAVDESLRACEAINVCVADTCQAVPQEQNADFGKAAAYVGLLNDMALNWHETEDIVHVDNTCTLTWPDGAPNRGGEPLEVCTQTRTVIEEGGALQFFSGRSDFCRKSILGALNCCSDSGWANGTFSDCRDHELALLSALHSGRAVHYDSSCYAKALFVCLVKARHYCIFGSKLGRVFNTEVQRVQGFSFECRPLTYAEMETVDFSEVDLTPVYADMIAEVNLPDAGILSGALEDNIDAVMPVAREAYE